MKVDERRLRVGMRGPMLCKVGIWPL